MNTAIQKCAMKAREAALIAERMGHKPVDAIEIVARVLAEHAPEIMEEFVRANFGFLEFDAQPERRPNLSRWYGGFGVQYEADTLAELAAKVKKKEGE